MDIRPRRPRSASYCRQFRGVSSETLSESFRLTPVSRTNGENEISPVAKTVFASPWQTTPRKPARLGSLRGRSLVSFLHSSFAASRPCFHREPRRLHSEHPKRARGILSGRRSKHDTMAKSPTRRRPSRGHPLRRMSTAKTYSFPFFVRVQLSANQRPPSSLNSSLLFLSHDSDRPGDPFSHPYGLIPQEPLAPLEPKGSNPAVRLLPPSGSSLGIVPQNPTPLGRRRNIEGPS